MRVRVVVEGRLDLAVVRRLLTDRGLTAMPVGRFGGREVVLNKLVDYNRAAQWEPWLVLVDLDRAECGPGLIAEHLAEPAGQMTFRVAVRAIESWLLADPGIARFLRVAVRALPPDPDAVANPKQRLVEIVREESSSRAVRAAIVPPRRARGTGQRYSATLSQFAADQWDPARAAQRSDSLRRSIDAIARIGGG